MLTQKMGEVWEGEAPAEPADRAFTQAQRELRPPERLFVKHRQAPKRPFKTLG